MKISRYTEKATRAEAYSLIVDMKMGRRKLSQEDIDSLLLYFAPSLPKNAKTVEQWVAKAAANAKEPRDYLRYLYVKDGVIMASDGNRAHRGETTLADGYYCPRTLARVDYDGVFPDLDRVYPDCGQMEPIDIAELERGATYYEKTGKTLAYLSAPGGVAVNERYLADATNNQETGTIYNDTQFKRLMAGSNEFGEWVIMGLRV
jgi:hypothetical protein